jgi:hypothetical protein
VSESMELKPEEAIDALPDELRDTPVTTQTGLAAIAMNFALKYADTITCKDGTLYQQYKLEGRNLHALHLDEVFHYAKQIEKHLLEAPSRLAMMVLDAVGNDIEEAIEAELADDPATDEPVEEEQA